MKPTIKVQRQERCQVAELMNAPKRTTDINYAKKNVEKLREKQEENKRKKEDEKMPQKEPFKLKRFQKVESMVYKTSEEARATKKPQTREKPMGEEPRIVTYDSDYAPPRAPSQVSTGKDYVYDNAVQAIHAAPPKPEKKHVEDAKAVNPNYGKVPHYLEEYKAQQELERERRKLAEENKDCPPGMRVMGKEEQMETLEMLYKGKEEVFQGINRLPIASNTAAVQRRRNELESKLVEIENAIKTFSRPKVYVSLT